MPTLQHETSGTHTPRISNPADDIYVNWAYSKMSVPGQYVIVMVLDGAHISSGCKISGRQSRSTMSLDFT